MKKAIQKLQQMLGWSDRIGSDEVAEIQDIILLLKLENNTVDVVNDLKRSLQNNLISTQQVLDLMKHKVHMYQVQ